MELEPSPAGAWNSLNEIWPDINGSVSKVKYSLYFFLINLKYLSTVIQYLWTSDCYGPVRNAFDAGKFISWASGRGLGPGNLEVFGPQIAVPTSCRPAIREFHFCFSALVPASLSASSVHFLAQSDIVLRCHGLTEIFLFPRNVM